MYGGIDDDVRRIFFSLDAFTLKLVFNKYEKQFGEGKRKYAESTFKKWKSGEVQMGGEISDRLVRLVPPFLSFDQKYKLIEKLWDRFRQKTSMSITISPNGGFEAAIAIVMDAIDRVDDQELPSAVIERLEWLAADDAVAAQALLNEVAKREGEIVASTIETELRQLLSLVVQHSDKNVIGSRTVNLPGATVHIHLGQTAPTPRRANHMNEPNNQPPNPNQERHLSRTDPSQLPRNLAPIQNPNDLLGEALRRMSPQKQEEIIAKATDEALRIQVKQADADVDAQRAEKAVDTVAQQASTLAETGTEFNLRREERLEHGMVSVSVSNKRPTVAERLGRCFIATACYGDYDHPTVLVLRRFRDEILAGSRAGTIFIDWYYRAGPLFAKRIEGRAVIRAAGRLLLSPLVLTARVILVVKALRER